MLQGKGGVTYKGIIYNFDFDSSGRRGGKYNYKTLLFFGLFGLQLKACRTVKSQISF